MGKCAWLVASTETRRRALAGASGYRAQNPCLRTVDEPYWLPTVTCVRALSLL